MKSTSIIEGLKEPNSEIIEQIEDDFDTSSYAIRMHPMAQLKVPDLLDRDRSSMFDILCSIIYTSLPLILSLQLNNFTSLVNIYLIGNHEGSQKLAAIGLATLIANICGFMVIENISVGFAVLCSYFKKNQYEQIGFLYQKTLGINFFICILITPILYLAQKALISIGFSNLMSNLDQHITIEAANYIWTLVPSFYMYSFFDTTRNYLQSQQVIYPALIINSISAVIHCALAYIFIVQMKLGLTGAAWTRNVTEAINALALYAYIIKYQPTKESWIQWDIRATNNIYGFLKLVFSHEVFFYFEIVTFQILGILACFLSNVNEINAHIALANSLSVLYFGYMGISYCLQKSFSNSIQQNDVHIGKKKVSLGILLILIVSGIAVVNVIKNSSGFINLFQKNQQTSDFMEHTMFLFVCVAVGEGIHIMLLGIIKTLQERSVWKKVVLSSYAIGLGSASVLVLYFKMGVLGIWIGYATGLLICLTIEIWFISKIDWEDYFGYVRGEYKKVAQEARVSKIEISSHEIK